MICGKLKNFDFSLINPLCVQSIKNNVLCLFLYLSNHLVIGPNFSFSHRSQSQGYKGGSQKFSPTSLYRSRYVTCGKWKIDFSRIYSSPLLSCWNHLLTHSLVLSSHFPQEWSWVQIFILPLLHFSFSHRSRPINFEGAKSTKVIRQVLLMSVDEMFGLGIGIDWPPWEGCRWGWGGWCILGLWKVKWWDCVWCG